MYPAVVVGTEYVKRIERLRVYHVVVVGTGYMDRLKSVCECTLMLSVVLSAWTDLRVFMSVP